MTVSMRTKLTISQKYANAHGFKFAGFENLGKTHPHFYYAKDDAYKDVYFMSSQVFKYGDQLELDLHHPGGGPYYIDVTDGKTQIPSPDAIANRGLKGEVLVVLDKIESCAGNKDVSLIGGKIFYMDPAVAARVPISLKHIFKEEAKIEVSTNVPREKLEQHQHQALVYPFPYLNNITVNHRGMIIAYNL